MNIKQFYKLKNVESHYLIANRISLNSRDIPTWGLYVVIYDAILSYYGNKSHASMFVAGGMAGTCHVHLFVYVTSCHEFIYLHLGSILLSLINQFISLTWNSYSIIKENMTIIQHIFPPPETMSFYRIVIIFSSIFRCFIMVCYHISWCRKISDSGWLFSKSAL